MCERDQRAVSKRQRERSMGVGEFYKVDRESCREERKSEE